MTYAPNFAQADYLPTEFQVPSDPKKAMEWISNRERLTADSMNLKEIATYDLGEDLVTAVSGIEQQTGQQWFGYDYTAVTTQVFPRRSGWRKVFWTDAIAPNALLTFPHNIVGITQVVRLWGIGNIAAGWEPIPYAAVNPNRTVEMISGPVNIQILNGAAGAAPAIVNALVVIEYLKQ